MRLQKDGKGGEEFAGRRELLALVNLLPQGHRTVLTLVDVKGCPQEPMKEEEGDDVVGDVGECPAELLRQSGNQGEHQSKGNNQQYVRGPCTT